MARRFARLAAGLLLALTAQAVQAQQAQEFHCTVTLDYRQVSGAGFTFLNDLQRDAQAYLNQNNWTDDRFQEEERIECSMQIVIEESLSLTNFRARLILTSRRPIYGTAQNTVVFQVNDADWQFEYAQGTPLIFETERYNALTSVLDFYAYLMLGYDYDTFSELGGEAHFQKARRILELAQAQNGIGWDALGSNRSRAELINQLLDARFQPLRKGYFKYHFHGLDHFINSPQTARAAVFEVLNDMQTLYEEVSRQYTLDLFFSVKFQELPGIFEQSSLSAQAYAVLSQLDPSHLTHYNRLLQ